MKPIDIGFVKPPEICDKCGQKIMSLVASVDSGVNQLMHHCPHHQTVILLELAEQDGKRSITKWILESPATEEYVIALANKLGESLGAEMETYHSGMVQ